MSTHLNLDQIEQADRAQLTLAWNDAFKERPPRGTSQPFMRLALSFDAQARQNGGLDRRTKKAIRSARRDLQGGQSKQKSGKLEPGTYILREWNGHTHRVDVLDKGFRWNGQTYRSLSKIAHAITGTRWSGPRFFGVQKAKP